MIPQREERCVRSGRRRAMRDVIVGLAMCVCVLVLAPQRALADGLKAEPVGQGDTTLVLIHGFGMSGEIWDDYIERSKDDFVLIAPTIRGFGGTAAPDAPAAEDDSTPWMDVAVEDLADVVDGAEGDKIYLVGQGSMGGFLAVRTALEHPDKIAGVIIVDAYLPAMPIGNSIPEGSDRMDAINMFDQILGQVPDAKWEEIRAQLQDAKGMISDPESLAEIEEMLAVTPREVLTTYLIEMMKTDLRPTIDGLEPPLLCIFAWPTDMTSQMAETKKICMSTLGKATRAQIVTAVGSRQLVMYDRSEGFDKAMKTFTSGGTVDVVLQ